MTRDQLLRERILVAADDTAKLATRLRALSAKEHMATDEHERMMRDMEGSLSNAAWFAGQIKPVDTKIQNMLAPAPQEAA